MTDCLANIVNKRSPGQFTGIYCGEPATVTVEYGCVHEHIRTELFCPGHAEKIISGDATQACTTCWKAGHPCPLLGRIVHEVAP
jgi:hypothetical protein